MTGSANRNDGAFLVSLWCWSKVRSLGGSAGLDEIEAISCLSREAIRASARRLKLDGLVEIEHLVERDGRKTVRYRLSHAGMRATCAVLTHERQAVAPYPGGAP